MIGAGASCELDLPSGAQLKGRILDVLRTTDENAYGFVNPEMHRVLRRKFGEDPRWLHVAAPWKAAATRIARGLPLALSIDNFLHAHQEDADVVELGKLAIALVMLEAERGSKLFAQDYYSLGVRARPEPSLDNVTLLETWYPRLAQLLMSQVQRTNAHQAFGNTTFVIFNYDRCLEHYLWLALQAYFDISEAEAALALADVAFIHPYGSLGPLPWQRDSTGDAVPLGGNADVLAVSERIRTFTESLHSEVGAKVRGAIADAHTILILGFGYLDQNVELLCPSSERNAFRVMSTALGVSEVDQAVIRDQMCRFGYARDTTSTLICPSTCRQLFDDFWLELSLR